MSAADREETKAPIGPLQPELEQALAATRVPGAHETGEVLARARRALVRIADRESADRLREAEEAAVRLHGTYANDLAPERFEGFELSRGLE